MAKKNVVLVKLVSTAGTGYFYVCSKNPKSMGSKKLNFRKYDPVVRKHVMFEEKKLSS